MCRMCLVERAASSVTRDQRGVYAEDGSPKVRWMPKLQTACTQRVAEGMVVRTDTEQVVAARVMCSSSC